MTIPLTFILLVCWPVAVIHLCWVVIPRYRRRVRARLLSQYNEHPNERTEAALRDFSVKHGL